MTLTTLELRDPDVKDKDVALVLFKLNFSLLISANACISASLAAISRALFGSAVVRPRRLNDS